MLGMEKMVQWHKGGHRRGRDSMVYSGKQEAGENSEMRRCWFTRLCVAVTGTPAGEITDLMGGGELKIPLCVRETKYQRARPQILM